MSIEITRCSIRQVKIAKPDKNILWQNTLCILNMKQQSPVAGLPRETNNVFFDIVRVAMSRQKRSFILFGEL